MNRAREQTASSPQPSPPLGEEREKRRHKTARFPVVSLTLLAVILAVAVFPPLGSILVYDRAAILRGEVWRLITSNLVHFSASHLQYDMLALGMAGCLIEYRGYRHFGWLCGFAAVAIGGALFVFQPDMRFYGGASGIATAAVVSLALHGLAEDGLWRRICALALAAVVVKIIAEFATGQSLFLGSAGGELVNCPLSHLTGGVVAVLGCGVARYSILKDLKTDSYPGGGRGGLRD